MQWWFQNHRRRLRQQSKGVSSTVKLVARRTRQHRRQSPYVCNVQPHPLGKHQSSQTSSRTRNLIRVEPMNIAINNINLKTKALGWTDSFTGTEWSTHPSEYQPQFSASIAEDCSSTSSSPINYRHPPPPTHAADTSFDHQDHTFEERYQQPTNDIPQEENPSYTGLDQQWNSFMKSPHFVSNGNSYQSTMNCSSELYAFPQRRSCYYSDCSHYQNYW